ncbi:MAG: hypothetical protein IIU10_00460 [Paludibacteraceae bacterium]|nr:hypothetical protein [Paludibacteraceae bacterium]
MTNKLLYRWMMMLATCLLLPVSVWAEEEPVYAGINVAEATVINDTMELLVRVGDNYMKVEPEHLPATFVYIPDSAFGPLPTAIVMGDTVPASVVFSGCRMSWVWEVTRPEDETAQLVSIVAHEDATVIVKPLMCPADAETTEEAWDSLRWHETVYTESGDYTKQMTTEAGCHYTETLHLTIHKTLYNSTPVVECDSFVQGGVRYTESGEYVLDTVALPNGDRQINSLALTIHRSTAAELVVEQFGAYLSPLGKTYTESGVYTDTTTNTAGCDSVITFRVTIHSTTLDTIYESACESYTFGTKTYTASGTYNDTIQMPGGDREVKTLVLTIHHATTDEQYIRSCDSYTSPLGHKYTTSGDYTEKTTNIAGCDSTILLHLTIAHTTFGELTTDACLSYRAPSGKTYTESGVYTDTTTNIAGCDSIITLRLTIIPDCFAYDTVYFCRGLNTQHEELIGEGLMRRYEPYTFESPATWDYMEGVIVRRDGNRTLVDLHRAETNLANHYVGGLEPVDGVTWSFRAKGETTYHALTADAQPQWISSGVVAMQVVFLCGHTYRNDFSTGTEALDEVETDAQPMKVIRNGQVVIIRGNAAYTPLGQKIQ